MRKLFPFVAVALLYFFTPGLCELADVALHVAAEGDVHASDADRHAEHGDSHGDDGECHTCFCHTSAVFVVSVGTHPSASIPPNTQSGVFARVGGASDGAVDELFRPPIA